MAAHSTLGASAAKRWMNCPGSIRLSAGREGASSVFAEEGSAAHELCETCLKHDMDPYLYIGSVVRGFEVTDEMAEAVQVYLDTVKSYVASNEPDGVVLLIEKRFSLDTLNPPIPMFGTSDATIYHRPRRKVIAIDFKYGRGVAVEVIEGGRPNAQLSYYALGALLDAPDGFEADNIEVVVVQPRAHHKDGPVRAVQFPVDELIGWSVELLDMAERTQEPDAPLAAGDWCRFCPAKPDCPELKREALESAMVAFDGEDLDDSVAVDTMTPAQLATALTGLPLLEMRIKAIRERAFRLLEKDCDAIPGWKLVEGRKSRKWNNETAALDTLLGLGLERDELVKEKVLTPAQAEKLLGKDRKSEVVDLITTHPGKATLAPAHDARPALALSAADAFDGE